MSSQLEEIRTINGKPYRLGFLLSDSDILQEKLPAELARLRRREPMLASSERLYHYTSLAGLKGIVEGKGLWASDNRFMNDAHELRHGIELAESIVRYKLKRTSDVCFSNILKEVVDELNAPILEGKLVACFTTARDSLEQWRGYGPSGAVCICFGSRFEGERPLFVAPDLLPRRVFYRWREKVVLLLSVIRRYEIQYKLDREAMPEYWPCDHDAEYVKSIVSRIIYSAAGFKHAAFEQESEVRIIVHPDNADRFGGLQFRVSPLGIVPFIDTASYTGEGVLPIREVLVGPSPNQELIAAGLRTFLDANGHESAVVNISQVPFRNF